jgi:hypothetical protein
MKIAAMTRIKRSYMSSVVVILTLTALAKLYSATGLAKVLDLPEALLPLSNRQALLLLGVIELVIVLALLVGRNDAMKLICVAWLSSNFVLYRLASFLLVVGRPCPCLGSITEKLPLNPAVIDRILLCLVIYMLLGSCLFLAALRWGLRRGISQQSGFPQVVGESIP